MSKNPGGSTETTRSNAAAVQSLSLDEIFATLQHERRRRVISRLQTAENPISLTDFADELAAEETETSTDDVSEAEMTRVSTSLYHVHLPKLADAGIVEYDWDEDTITLAENVEQVEPYLGLNAE